MHKIIFITILASFCLVLPAKSAEYNYSSADSITYQLFIQGDWNNLIKTGNEILKQNIDFKTLQQRIGYAWFMKENYLMSRWHYSKALKFDATDEITNVYLYYTGLYTGDESFMRYYAGRLNDEDKKALKIKPFRWVDAVDVEYNYKTGYESYSRSAPNYYRLGINTQLGYRLSLYQTASSFNQTFYSTTNVVQNEYYALLSWNPLANLTLQSGYHFLGSTVDAVNYNAHMFYGKAAYRYHIFDGSVSASSYTNSTDIYNQIGIHLGATIPELKNLYLSAAVDTLFGTGLVTTFSAGFAPVKSLWFSAYTTQGKQINYVNMNGIYVYNSSDYATSKMGASLFWYAKKHLTLYANYSYEEKNITEYVTDPYYQHSITGGIIWKF